MMRIIQMVRGYMRLFKKLQAMLKGNQTLLVPATTPTTPICSELADRLARLERNYLVLLKRVLAMDGVELQYANARTKVFSHKILTTDDKGLNERKPTYH